MPLDVFDRLYSIIPDQKKIDTRTLSYSIKNGEKQDPFVEPDLTRGTVVPRSYATPSYAIFAAMLF